MRAAQSHSDRIAMCGELYQCIRKKRFEDGIALADELVQYSDIMPQAFCNALWLVLPKNTEHPIAETRARRYLAASLLRAPENPSIHLNAGFVYLELSEHDAAFRQFFLAKQRGVDLVPYFEAEPSLEVLKTDPRWAELGNQSHTIVDDVSWREIVEDCFERNRFDDAVPAILLYWQHTRSSELANLLDTISFTTGRRPGYLAFELEQAIKEPLKSHPIVDIDRLGDRLDPRLSFAFIRLITAHPRQPLARFVRRVWPRVMQCLAKQRDRRLIGPLRELAGWLEAMNPGLIGTILGKSCLETAKTIEHDQTKSPLHFEEITFIEDIQGRLPNPPAIQIRPEDFRVPPTSSGEQIDELLELWRKTRNPRVATVLVARDLSKQTIRLADEIQKLDPRVKIEDFFECDDIQGIKAAELVWEHFNRGADPRTVEQLLQVLDNPPFIYPYKDDGVEDFWDVFFETINRFEDVRALEGLKVFENRIRLLCREADREAEEDPFASEPIGPNLAHKTRQAIQHLETILVDSLEQVELAWIIELEQTYEIPHSQTVQKGKALLNAVLDDPDSNACRLEYAKHLEQKGNPYGEFIRLQIEGKEPIKQQELLAEHESEFVGVLGALTGFVRFEKGFVSEMSLDVTSLLEHHVGHFPLQTICRILLENQAVLDFQPDGEWPTHEDWLNKVAFFFSHSALRSLRRIDGITTPILVKMNLGSHTNIENLSLKADTLSRVKDPSRAWSSIYDSLRAFPNLRFLQIDSIFAKPDYICRIEGIPDAIVEVGFVWRFCPTRKDWEAIFSSFPSNRFFAVTFRWTGFEVVFERSHAFPSSLFYVRIVQKQENLESIFDMFKSLKKDRIRFLDWVVDDRVAAPNNDQISRIKLLLAHHKELRLISPHLG